MLEFVLVRKSEKTIARGFGWFLAFKLDMNTNFSLSPQQGFESLFEKSLV